MISRKQIAVLYNVHPHTVTELLHKTGIVLPDNKGKGKRCLLTPIEFELFKQKIGAPIRNV